MKNKKTIVGFVSAILILVSLSPSPVLAKGGGHGGGHAGGHASGHASAHGSGHVSSHGSASGHTSSHSSISRASSFSARARISSGRYSSYKGSISHSGSHASYKARVTPKSAFKANRYNLNYQPTTHSGTFRPFYYPNYYYYGGHGYYNRQTYSKEIKEKDDDNIKKIANKNDIKVITIQNYKGTYNKIVVTKDQYDKINLNDSLTLTPNGLTVNGKPLK